MSLRLEPSDLKVLDTLFDLELDSGFQALTWDLTWDLSEKTLDYPLTCNIMTSASKTKKRS